MSCGWMPSIVNETTAAFCGRRADDAQARNCLQRVGRVLEQLVLRRRDALHAERLAGSRWRRRGRSRRRCAACRPRTCAAGRCRSSSSKVTARIMSPPPCHGGMLSSSASRAIQHADAGRAAHLVAGEAVEIAVERPHVDAAGAARPARRRAARERRAPCARSDECARPARSCRARSRRAPARRGACAADSSRLERGEIDLAGCGDRRDLERAPVCSQTQLPRHDVGVVLEPGDQDLVAGLEPRPHETLCDEVDRFRRAAHEHDLLVPSAALMKRAPCRARLRKLGRLLAQRVHAAVHVRVRRRVVVGHRVDDALRPLARGGVVEVGERLAGRPARLRIGKSRRTRSTSNGLESAVLRVTLCDGAHEDFLQRS